MKILITTPMGKIGRRILPELLAPEFSVRVILRDPARLPKAVLERVEIVRGAADDTQTLRRALEGVESMFWCVPSESLQETDVEHYYERFACAAWQAIRQAGTPQVVTISAGGKGLARNAGSISGLHAMEEILDESGAAIRHLRCTWLMENFLGRLDAMSRQGELAYPMPRHVAIPMAAVTDVVDVALRWLVRRDWEGIQGIAVHGPQDLSFGQAASILERALGRPVEYQEQSPNHYLQNLIGLGASVEYAQSRLEMFSQFARGISRAEPRTAESTTPTTLSAWAESELLPAVESLGAPIGKAGRGVAPKWSPDANAHRLRISDQVESIRRIRESNELANRRNQRNGDAFANSLA